MPGMAPAINGFIGVYGLGEVLLDKAVNLREAVDFVVKNPIRIVRIGGSRGYRNPGAIKAAQEGKRQYNEG